MTYFFGSLNNCVWSVIKLEPHGTNTDTDTDIRDAPIVYFCKRVHDSLSCTVGLYT